MTEPQQAAQNHEDHEPQYLSHRQIVRVLAGLMMGMFLSALDQTIVATAIRTIGDDLQGLSLQAWVTTAYLITATITTPLYGKLGDIYGRKQLFLWSIGIFVVGSVMCTFAGSMYQLAGFRALQGVGAGGLFSLALAIIGDIRRFHTPERLVAYIGLNPGQRQSGKNKDIRLGIGKRGRGDLRQLLIQGAQSVMNKCRDSALGKWGWSLFVRKGHRNIAVAGVARKLVVQVWHTLQGRPSTEAETSHSFRLKLQKLALTLGKDLRQIGRAHV